MFRAVKIGSVHLFFMVAEKLKGFYYSIFDDTKNPERDHEMCSYQKRAVSAATCRVWNCNNPVRRLTGLFSGVRHLPSSPCSAGTTAFMTDKARALL
ncbi:hypothetical protein EVAR_55831_1 [Eumeta japonica]|uniref:Uncharacterized protein n=1 Tax=Eumeta variegata TaxID=151549 RepID=A0A4C1YZE1_EUMVA|nr:hypothetical protein EVAR_55831_1 [Eumeta japonica]